MKIKWFNPLGRKTFCFVLGFMCLLMPTTTMAQDDDLDFSSMSLEDLLNVEVTVASKTEETVADAPSSVTVFTRSEIQNMGITYLEELLNYVPGFQSQRQISYGQSNTIQVRGKPGNGYLSKEVLVLIDGTRINDAFTGGSSMINRYVAIDNIKQVEIIRGPGSALYGSNAFLGVINIVTVKDVNEAKMVLGSYEARDLSANFHVNHNDWKISGFVRAYNDSGDDYQVKKDFFARSGPAHDPREGMDITTRIAYKDFYLDFGFMEKDLPDHMGGIAVGGENISRNEEKQTRISFGWKFEPTDKFDLTISGAHVEAEEYMLWHWPEILGPGQALDFGLTLDVFNTNLNVDMNYQISENNSLSFGASYEERGVDDNSIISSANSQIIFLRGAAGTTENVTQKVNAFYVQDQHRFGERVKVIAGVRYDDYNDFGDTINPRAAAIFSTPWKSKFKLMYGEAFLAPTNSEQYQKNTLASNGNPDLDPENISTLEFAYNQSFSKANLTLTYFTSDVTDLIVLERVDDVNTIPVNRGEITLEGVELEFTAALGGGVFLRGNYTSHIDSEDPWSADDYGGLILNWSKKRFNLNLHGTYTGKIDKVPDQSSYTIFNASIKYSLLPNFDLQLTGLNISDENSVSPDAPFTDTGIEVERRGQSINFGATYKF